MLYVLRLSSGDCIIAAAGDERSARAFAAVLKLQPGTTVESVRPLSRFGVRLSPTEEGSLEIESWDDASLDDILAHEYPLLNEAFRRANSVPIIPPNSKSVTLEQFREAQERNAATIRDGLRREIDRLSVAVAKRKRKAASK